MDRVLRNDYFRDLAAALGRSLIICSRIIQLKILVKLLNICSNKLFWEQAQVERPHEVVEVRELGQGDFFVLWARNELTVLRHIAFQLSKRIRPSVQVAKICRPQQNHAPIGHENGERHAKVLGQCERETAVLVSLVKEELVVRPELRVQLLDYVCNLAVHAVFQGAAFLLVDLKLLLLNVELIVAPVEVLALEGGQALRRLDQIPADVTSIISMRLHNMQGILQISKLLILRLQLANFGEVELQFLRYHVYYQFKIN